MVLLVAVIGGLALFTLEMCALCVAKEGYAFGFYFWLDLIATASLLLDVPEFMAASGLRRAQLARVGAAAPPHRAARPARPAECARAAG